MWRKSGSFLLQVPLSVGFRSRPCCTSLMPMIDFPPISNQGINCRAFGSGRNRNRKKVHKKPFAKPVPPKANPRIQPRPDGEKEVESKFSLPDKQKEMELGKIQNEVQHFHKLGQYPKALKAANDLLQETKAHFGNDHPATAAAYNNIGLMQKLQGSFDESRAAYRAAQKIYKVSVGADHSSYASTLHNLGNLNRSQVHFDTSLKATDRLSLVESALEFLEQAYHIRANELGREHPHTVASRSSWGATLAARILHHHKMTQASNESNDLLKKRYYVSILPTDVTETAWVAAEEHLRQALETAVKNPRGASIATKTSSKGNAPNRGGKKKKVATPAASKTIQTLSAANAAQNLAVFLKTRATTVQPVQMEWLEEGKSLYNQVLLVQRELLEGDGTHPDMYATKHSLAELMEAMGDEEAANALRQEIVDSYSPEPEPNEEKL